MNLDKEVHHRMASFCQGTLNVELEDRTNKPKAWTYSPDSQTITDFIISGHFRLTSGRTSDQNFISGTFYCTKSGALKFQGESFWICFDTVVIDKDISEKQPLGRNLPKSDATVKAPDFLSDIFDIDNLQEINVCLWRYQNASVYFANNRFAIYTILCLQIALFQMQRWLGLCCR